MFKKIAQTFGTRLATAIINFLIAVAVSQYLGAAGKGEQGILITTIALVLIFSNIIGGASLVYLVPRHRLKKLLPPAYAWSVIMSALLGPAFAFFGMIPPEWALHLSLLSLLNSWISIHSSILIGKKKIGWSNLVNLLQSLFTVAFLLLFILGLSVCDIYSYIYALYGAYTLCFFLSLALVIPLLKQQDTVQSPQSGVLADLFRYGFINQLAHVAQLLSFRISYFFLDSISGEAAVGIYSNGVSLMESVWMISGSIALVQYSDIANSSDRQWAQQLTARLTRYALWASLLVILPLVLLPPSVYIWIFGPEFGGVCGAMRWLAPGVLIFNYALVTGHYFSGTGKYYVNALASAAGLVVTVLLSLLLIPLYSVNGAAMAASVSYACTSLVVLWWFAHESKMKTSLLLPHFRDIADLWQEFKTLIKIKKSDA